MSAPRTAVRGLRGRHRTRLVEVELTSRGDLMTAQHVIARGPKDRRGDTPYLLAQVTPVHTWLCRAWRWGKKAGPCNCGARALFDAWLKRKLKRRRP